MTAVNIGVVNLGRIGYHASLQLQSKISISIKKKTTKWQDGVMLLLEYPPLYTVGIRDKSYTANDEERLRKTGAEFYRTDRGGLITYHGPGQLVIYPVVNLKSWRKPLSIRWYIETLEETVINLCQTMGVSAHRYHPYPGIWVGESKLCAVGVHASRHVTTHGIAINCNTDLNWFKHIVPCGIEGKGVTSFTELLQREIKIQDIILPFFNSFQTNFYCKLHNTTISDVDDSLEQSRII
uniref:Octanoyl-[acyl-carrier-protein]:protein N-octanoyltransferase LIPT2, mitochondrial n=1 Tax=Panstrongylus lignarius TaxID=156445 RepID=A0A224XJ29_9HEMI